jgi:tetratricopeptide (TPR) repeat protein
LSTVYSAAKKSAEATEQLQLILEQDPNDATANNDLGYMWADEGKNLAEAEKLIRKALALDREERTKGKAVGPDADRENAAYADSLGWVLFRGTPGARKGVWAAGRQGRPCRMGPPGRCLFPAKRLRPRPRRLAESCGTL